MDVKVHNGCIMVHSGTHLYIINSNNSEVGEDVARASVRKIIDNDESVRVLSYNESSYNYIVDGVLVNSKPTADKWPPQSKEYILVRETPYLYGLMTQKVRHHPPTWVRNIISGNAEGETTYIVADDYMIMPDFKWDHDKNNLYLLVLFTNKRLRSVRDLAEGDLQVLRRARDDVTKLCCEKFGLSFEKLRMYFHYIPSAWQLHMHVQHIDSPPSTSNQSSRAITLTDVIQNIIIDPKYYSKATIECIVSKRDSLKYYGDGLKYYWDYGGQLLSVAESDRPLAPPQKYYGDCGRQCASIAESPEFEESTY